MLNHILIPAAVVDIKMVPFDNLSEHQPSRKAMLHCPSCNHENHINGDWIIQIYPNHLDYECPECGNVIESRYDGLGMITPA